jgi:hypothetical protein
MARLTTSFSHRISAKNMSPLFTPIILVILLGSVLFLIGIITRKKKLIFIGAPVVALLLAWYVIASIAPSPEGEFDRIFGSNNRSFVTDIDTIKPTMMDGYFISFRISPADFDNHIRPQLVSTEFTNFHLLRGEELPTGWSKSVEDTTTALMKEVDRNEILVYYDATTKYVYASVQYDQW